MQILYYVVLYMQSTAQVDGRAHGHISHNTYSGCCFKRLRHSREAYHCSTQKQVFRPEILIPSVLGFGIRVSAVEIVY